MRLSITVKWILTLLLSSLIGVALVGFFAYWTTSTEFDRFLNESAEQEFVADVTSYYETQGSWQGINDYLRVSQTESATQDVLATQDVPAAQDIPDRRDDPDGREDFTNQLYAVADSNGRILSEAGFFKPDEMASADSMKSAISLYVDDELVGYALSAAPPPGLSPHERQYLDNTNRALVVGIIGASAVAVLIGVLLSRQFLHPLSELTEAITAMKSGDLHQQVTVNTNDELGQLAETFNQMSEQIHRANQLRQQMTADIAHDLRTPLQVITGYIEAMRDGILPATTERFDAMNQEALLLKRLVEDLRTLSLADAKELKLLYQDIEVQSLLKQVQDTFEPIAQQAGIPIQVEAPDDLPQLRIDRERMVQVLTNLMSNALRYTSRGGTITLGASASQDRVSLTVQDTGTGIPQDQLENIFERFYRVDKSRHEVDGESGLGLAIVKSIVEAHSGTIKASSKLGEGTTFTISLPI